MNSSKNSTIDALNEQRLLTSKATYNTVIDTYSIAATKDFNAIMKNKKVLKLLHKFKHAPKNEQNIIRGELYRLLYKDYEDMQKLYVRQFHFHTFDGKSLLRFHLPYKNGDLLINSRTSIRIANTKYKRVIGYEGGRIYPGYRYVFPIIDKGEHLGSVEFSISFEGIEEKLHSLLPYNDYQQIMTKESTIDKVFKSNYHFFSISTFSKNYYYEAPAILNSSKKNTPLMNNILKLVKNTTKLEKKLKLHKDFSISFIDKGKGYSLNFIAFNNIDNQHAGYIVVFNRLDKIVDITKAYELYSFLIIITASILFILATITIKQLNKSKLFKEELLKMNASLKEAQSIAHFGSWEIDLKTNKLYWSDEVYKIFGLEPKSIEITQEIFLSYVHPDDRQKVIDIYNKSLKEKTIYKIRHRIITDDGKTKYLEEYSHHKYDTHNVAIKTIGAVYDVTTEVEKYLKLEKFVDLQQSIVILTDGSDFEFANKSFFTFFGYDNLNDFKNKFGCICELFIKKDEFFSLDKIKKGEKNWIESLLNLSERKRIVSMLDTTSTPHAFLVAINNYDENQYVIDFSDISETMQEKLQLQNQANNDQLTKTYNRVFFETSIHGIMKKHHQQNLRTAIIFFDIDNFKQINDTFGHSIGDNVLIELTTLIKNIIRKSDYLLRWGGEEFIIISSANNIEDVKHMAEYLRISIEKLYIKDVGHFTCSFGIALHKKDEKIKTTIARADERLYEAKNSGRNIVK
jgi:diguanylate cyclase (GGDEF)-like protein/PAS domain S-box-containing protein